MNDVERLANALPHPRGGAAGDQKFTLDLAGMPPRASSYLRRHVFDTKQKGIMFAAAVGFCLHRAEVDGAEVEQKREGIRTEYFDSVDDTCFIDVLAVATHSDLSALANERQAERVDLFERCALLAADRRRSAGGEL